MATLLSQAKIAERALVLKQLKRSIKASHKSPQSDLTLAQYQNVISKSLGYPAWNLLVDDILDCTPSHFSNFMGACEFKGLLEPSDEVDIDEFWFDGAADQ